MDQFRVVDLGPQSIYHHQISAAVCFDKLMEVIDHLEFCLKVDGEGEYGEPLVKLDNYDDFVAGAKAIRDIERFYPHIKCFVVSSIHTSERTIGSGYSTFWGCRTEKQAQAIVDALNENKSLNREWTVLETGCAYNMLVKEGWTPAEAVEHMRR